MPLRLGLKKVYFPNIVFKLVREPNLPPNKVAFRIPPKVNKLDIRDYLKHIYKVDVLDVRTMNYATRPGITTPDGLLSQYRARFKKAIVTLKDDFEYPLPTESLEFMTKEEQIEARAISFRRLKGWKSRPKRLEKMVADRLEKLENEENENR